jgi:hypothetical protein
MRDLEQTLIQIGRELEWPETPDLASSVIATLRAAPAGAAEHPVPGAEQPAPGAEQPAPGTERRLREPEADKVDGRRAAAASAQGGLAPPSPASSRPEASGAPSS